MSSTLDPTGVSLINLVQNVKNQQKNLLKQKSKVTNITGLLASLVLAIVMFKRIAKKMKMRRKHKKIRRGIKSRFHEVIQHSQRQVLQAEHGRAVITMPSDLIEEYRDYMDRRRDEIMASTTMARNKSRRQATRPSTFAIPTEIAKMEYQRKNIGIPIVARLKALTSQSFASGKEAVREEPDKEAPVYDLSQYFRTVMEKNKHMDQKEDLSMHVKKS